MKLYLWQNRILEVNVLDLEPCKFFLLEITFPPTISNLLTYSGVEYQLRLRVNRHLPRRSLVDTQNKWCRADNEFLYESETHSFGVLFFTFFFFNLVCFICGWGKLLQQLPLTVWSQSKSSQNCEGAPISIPSTSSLYSSSSSPLLISSNSCPSPFYDMKLNRREKD